MNAPLINPLSQEHCDACTAVLQMEEQVLDLIHRCESAGLDCSDARRKYRELADFAAAIKAQFFPHKS